MCDFVFTCSCLFLPAWKNRLNLIYSPRGHLLTKANPLTGPRQNGSLTRLLLYIAAVMGTSLEILLLLICALLPRFEHFAHCLTPPGNSWCITAAMDQSICLLPALPLLHLLPARAVIPQKAVPKAALWVCTAHACLFTCTTSYWNQRINGHLVAFYLLLVMSG